MFILLLEPPEVDEQLYVLLSLFDFVSASSLVSPIVSRYDSLTSVVLFQSLDNVHEAEFVVALDIALTTASAFSSLSTSASLQNSL